MRYLLCHDCRDKMQLNDDDRAHGFKERRVEIPHAHRPLNLSVRTTTIEAGHKHIEERDVPKLKCDDCGKTIENGAPAVAVTQWSRQEPTPWEHEYAQDQANN